MIKKRVIGIICVIFVCLLIVITGTYFDKKNMINVYDRNGNKIAIIKRTNNNISLEADDDILAYIHVAWNDTVGIVSEKEDISEEKALDYIFKNDLDIYTYYDSDLSKCVTETGEKYGKNIHCDMAIALTDINGNIISCYNYDSKNKNINHVLAKTYAGSTMKPISVYAPAINDGVIDWSYMVMDEPYTQMTDIYGNLVDWPSNTSPYTYEKHMISEAVMKSMNTIAVKTLKLYGVDKSCVFLEEKLNMDLSRERGLMDEYGEDEILANIALGYLRDGVNVVDMSGFYQIFANGGLYRKPRSVSMIKSHKSIYFDNSYIESKQVISKETAYICNRILKLVTTEDGTGLGADVDGIDICGKTGTSDDFKDNWFVGFSPDYVCAVWYNGESLSLHDNKYSVMCFHDIMSDLPISNSDYMVPDDVVSVEVCNKTGKAANDNCSDTSIGYFVDDKIPDLCDCK